MKKNTSILLSWAITFVALLAFADMYFSQVEQHQHAFRFVEPIHNAVPIPTDRERIVPSETVKLEPGQLLDLSEYPFGESIIQKLTDRSYWVLNNLHDMHMYVGDSEVLLVDSPDGLDVETLLNRIASITPNPVTTLVYTHPHQDHLGGAAILRAGVEKRGGKLRIVGSEYLVNSFDEYQQSIPRPTEVVTGRAGYFDFDGQKIKLATPVSIGHSKADSYVLFPDRTIMFVDFIHADRLPLHGISGVQSMNGYITYLRHVAGEQWDFANLGHVNVGSRQDLDLTMQYIEDLYSTWFEVMPEYANMAELSSAKQQNDYVGIWLRNLYDRVAYEMAVRLEPKYGHLPQFELAIDHALKIIWDGTFHYDYINKPNTRPIFTPILPTK